MKDTKTLWGNVLYEPISHHIILKNGEDKNNVDLTDLFKNWYSDCFVNITIDVRVDRCLDETNTINDI